MHLFIFQLPLWYHVIIWYKSIWQTKGMILYIFLTVRPIFVCLGQVENSLIRYTAASLVTENHHAILYYKGERPWCINNQ